MVEDADAGHGGAPAKASVAAVGPVVDAGSADTHEVREAVSAHVCKHHRALGISKHEARALAFVSGQVHAATGFVAGTAGRSVPVEVLAARDDEVCEAVAGEIDHLGVGVAQVGRGQVFERDEGAPSRGCSGIVGVMLAALEVAGEGRAIADELPWTGAVEVCKSGSVGQGWTRVVQRRPPGPGL